MEHCDIAVIGAGPAGAATAIRAVRGGASVVVFDKAPRGRDKVCGDGLTPRAIAALDQLGIDSSAAHRIDGLRMIAGRRVRELPWPATGRFPAHGAVWPRRELDRHLIDAAASAGAEVHFEQDAEPIIENGRVVGVSTTGRKWSADHVVIATGAPGRVAHLLGVRRCGDEPFGLAIRTYAPTPRHDERLLEACLTLRDRSGTWLPGYGWMFPAGDGTVNIGVGVLSTMKGFKGLNLTNLLADYRSQVCEQWSLGPDETRPRAWRLPMSTTRRHGPGWVAVGDAAGLINPMNGEGIDYGLESGMVAADTFLASPHSAAVDYDRCIAERFDPFLRTGRRFSFLIGHPWILRNGLRFAVGTQSVADITLQVMGNLVDADTPGAAGRALRTADRLLAAADPLLRRTRADPGDARELAGTNRPAAGLERVGSSGGDDEP